MVRGSLRVFSLAYCLICLVIIISTICYRAYEVGEGAALPGGDGGREEEEWRDIRRGKEGIERKACQCGSVFTPVLVYV